MNHLLLQASNKTIILTPAFLVSTSPSSVPNTATISTTLPGIDVVLNKTLHGIEIAPLVAALLLETENLSMP